MAMACRTVKFDSGCGDGRAEARCHMRGPVVPRGGMHAKSVHAVCLSVRGFARQMASASTRAHACTYVQSPSLRRNCSDARVRAEDVGIRRRCNSSEAGRIRLASAVMSFLGLIGPSTYSIRMCRPHVPSPLQLGKEWQFTAGDSSKKNTKTTVGRSCDAVIVIPENAKGEMHVHQVHLVCLHL